MKKIKNILKVFSDFVFGINKLTKKQKDAMDYLSKLSANDFQSKADKELVYISKPTLVMFNYLNPFTRLTLLCFISIAGLFLSLKLFFLLESILGHPVLTAAFVPFLIISSLLLIIMPFSSLKFGRFDLYCLEEENIHPKIIKGLKLANTLPIMSRETTFLSILKSHPEIQKNHPIAKDIKELKSLRKLVTKEKSLEENISIKSNSYIDTI